MYWFISIWSLRITKGDILYNLLYYHLPFSYLFSYFLENWERSVLYAWMSYIFLVHAYWNLLPKQIVKLLRSDTTSVFILGGSINWRSDLSVNCHPLCSKSHIVRGSEIQNVGFMRQWWSSKQCDCKWGKCLIIIVQRT